MAKNAITTEYFGAVKTVQDVRGVIIGNLNKLDDPGFIKEFKKAYNAHRSDQQGKYGRYQSKAAVTADGYIKIATAIHALTQIKVGRSKIKLTVAFKLGGVNLSGDTKLIRGELKAMGFRWNPKTLEWYNSFATMPTIPEIPKSVKTETVKSKKAETEKPNKGEPTKEKAEKPKTESTKVAKADPKQPETRKTGKPTLAKPRKLEGDEKEKAMAEFNEKVAAVRAMRERRKARFA